MKKQLLLIGFIFLSCVGYSQNGINKDLKIELDSIMKSDQILREYINFDTTEERKKEILKEIGHDNDPTFRKRIWKVMGMQDSINLIKVEKIISIYGYPGKSLVGEPTNESAFYVIQHSTEIAKYLPLIKEAAEKEEILFTKYAMMLDRSLVQQGKEQIYGTQGQGKEITNKKTGKKEFFDYISPIQNPEKVNKRRKKAGFTTTVEENAKEIGIEYKVYTLDEIAKIN